MSSLRLPFAKSPLAWACVLTAAVAASACGDIVVADSKEDASKVDVAQAADVDAAPPFDAVAPVDTGPETTGIACLTEFDCGALIGKTPCKLPTCDNKICKWKLRVAGEACEDFSDVPGFCEVAQCDAAGQCLKKAKADGLPCGAFACGKKCAVGLCVAASVTDYDDKNPCTDDLCDQGKEVVHVPVPNFTGSCSDDNACTTADACIGGKCQGQPKVCNDNIECTLDICDKVTKKDCVFTPNPTKCDDGDPCTKDGCDLAEGCTAVGAQIGGKCDDANPCTKEDVCKQGTGKTASCKGVVDAASCSCTSDGDCAKNNTPCGGKFVCMPDKTCQLAAGSAIVCDGSKDTNCLENTCDPKTGQCLPKPTGDGKVCDDGDICTATSACTAGACGAQKPLPCDDGNPCTADSCQAKVGCAFVAGAAACDDKNACTAEDICSAGGCTGKKKVCDDGAFCTFDGCDGATGACSNETQDKLCDDANPCTTEKCSATSKSCSYVPNDTASCSDGNECTVDTCKGGTCTSVNQCQCITAATCMDGNPCTTDSCTAGKCLYTNADGGKCDTDDKCQKPGTGVCASSVCKTGNQPIDCTAQATACTSAACNPASGKCDVLAKGDGTLCQDGNNCTVGDGCKAGKCVAGAVPSCVTGNKPCEVGTCIPATPGTGYTCKVDNKANGSPCDDSKACTDGDVCGTGVCAGKPKVCPGSGPCVTAACDEVTKGCVAKAKAAGTACDDTQFCTSGETCGSAGACGGGQTTSCLGAKCQQGFCDEANNKCSTKPDPTCCVGAKDCVDGKPCTSDACDVASGKCVYKPISGCCNPIVWENHFDQGELNDMILDNTKGPSQGWQLRSQSPQHKTPTGTLYYGDPIKNNFNFENQASQGIAATPFVVVPKGGKLNFWLWMDTEMGDNVQWDNLIVYLQPQAGAKVVLWNKMTVGAKLPPMQWYFVDVPLPLEFGGQSQQIIFEFNTIDGAGNDGQGVFIDSIQILSTCGPISG